MKIISLRNIAVIFLFFGLMLIGNVGYFNVWSGNYDSLQILVSYSSLPFYLKIFSILIMLSLTALLFLHSKEGSLLSTIRGFVGMIIFCATGYFSGFLFLDYELMVNSESFILWFGILLSLASILIGTTVSDKKS
jgi:hypothetical protein